MSGVIGDGDILTIYIPVYNYELSMRIDPHEKPNKSKHRSVRI